MITCHELQHRYKKSEFALSIREFTFDAPGLTAIVGPNGSGKSTLLFLMSGLRKPKAGFVRYDDRNVYEDFELIKRDIHILSWDVALYDDVTGEDHLDLVSDLSDNWNRDLQAELTAELRIPLQQPAGKLSRGEHAKLKLILSLCQSPRVLLIDEITNDLDVESRKAIYKRLDAYSYETDGRVFVATNVITDMERYASHVVGMRRGEIVLNEPLDALKEKHAASLEEIIASTTNGAH